MIAAIASGFGEGVSLYDGHPEIPTSQGSVAGASDAAGEEAPESSAA